MDTTFKVKASELNIDFIEAIKKLFKDSIIKISISSIIDNEAEPKYSEDLLKSIENIEKSKNLISFTMEEFEEYSKKILQK